MYTRNGLHTSHTELRNFITVWMKSREQEETDTHQVEDVVSEGPNSPICIAYEMVDTII